MIANAIFEAVEIEVIGKEYMRRGEAVRQKVLSEVDQNGLVQNASGSPSFDHLGTSVECQAHVLLMEQSRNHCY